MLRIRGEVIIRPGDRVHQKSLPHVEALFLIRRRR